MKTNITYHAAVCAFVIEGDNVGRDVCLWRLYASIPKSSLATLRLNLMYESIHIANLHSDSITIK